MGGDFMVMTFQLIFTTTIILSDSLPYIHNDPEIAKIMPCRKVVYRSAHGRK